MAYRTKDGTEIPSQVDLLVVPMIEQFDAIGDPEAVAVLRDRIRAVQVPTESDRFAHLRLRGTFEHLGRLRSAAEAGGACPEFVDILERLRAGIARRHDSLPRDPDFPRARLSADPPRRSAWAEPAHVEAARAEATAPVRNEGIDGSKYDDILDL